MGWYIFLLFRRDIGEVDKEEDGGEKDDEGATWGEE